MSSLVRTIQKRIAKAQKYERQTQRVDVIAGKPQVVHLKRGEGDIIGPDGESIGSKHWPQVAAPTRAHTPKVKAPRGSRRGKHSKEFVAARVEARAQFAALADELGFAAAA